jgi:tetratricopeptide (TPR) repeat protein
MLISEWIQRGLGDKALSHLATLEKYFPRQKTTLAWGGIVRGDLHRAGKEYDAALEAYRTVFENYPDLGIYADWARERAASVLENLGQSGPARELRQKVRDPGRENGFRPNRVPVANIDAEKENRSEKR